MAIDYKRNEDKILKAVQQYVDSTYTAHYSSSSGRYVVDDWEDMVIAREAFLSNIVKYTKRLGKKEGWNPKDVMKIIHYSVFLINELGRKDDDDNNSGTASDDTSTFKQ
jgi:hypothetical protein